MNLPPISMTAEPFPHCVVDGVFNGIDLMIMINAWPKKHQQHTTNGYENNKGGTFSESEMNGYISHFIKANFFSQQFLTWLETITGITGLVCDPYKFALHETYSGGSLKPHLDYTINKRTGLQLRVNVILYLNEDWKEEYGGDLQLYEVNRMYGGYLSRPAVSIQPLFNRMVVFTMDQEAWHSCAPVTCPDGVTRRSIALNYFSIPLAGVKHQETTFKKSFLRRIIHSFNI